MCSGVHVCLLGVACALPTAPIRPCPFVWLVNSGAVEEFRIPHSVLCRWVLSVKKNYRAGELLLSAMRPCLVLIGLLSVCVFMCLSVCVCVCVFVCVCLFCSQLYGASLSPLPSPFSVAVTYHNWQHAFSVTQCMFAMIQQPEIKQCVISVVYNAQRHTSVSLCLRDWDGGALK